VALTDRTLGIVLPDEIVAQILGGRIGKWKVGKSQMEVQREDYVNGWGYDLSFILK
jgi:hypothetical protein